MSKKILKRGKWAEFPSPAIIPRTAIWTKRPVPGMPPISGFDFGPGTFRAVVGTFNLYRPAPQRRFDRSQSGPNGAGQTTVF